MDKAIKIADELEELHNLRKCKKHNILATHVLITGMYPNYHESLVCDKEIEIIDKLNCYQLDNMMFVDYFPLLTEKII